MRKVTPKYFIYLKVYYFYADVCHFSFKTLFSWYGICVGMTHCCILYSEMCWNSLTLKKVRIDLVVIYKWTLTFIVNWFWVGYLYFQHDIKDKRGLNGSKSTHIHIYSKEIFVEAKRGQVRGSIEIVPHWKSENWICSYIQMDYTTHN